MVTRWRCGLTRSREGREGSYRLLPPIFALFAASREAMYYTSATLNIESCQGARARSTPLPINPDATMGRAIVASQKHWTRGDSGASLPQLIASSNVHPESPPQWGASVVY